MPPAAPGIAVAVSSPGKSEIIASVVSSKPAIEAAFCNAARMTLVGSRSIGSTKDDPVSVVSGFSARRARSVAFQCFQQFRSQSGAVAPPLR